MSIHAIVWDIGGVLLRTENFAPRKALAEQLGLTPMAMEQMVFGKDDGFRAQLGEITFAEHWQNVATKMNMTLPEAVAFREAFFASDVLDMDLIERIRGYKSAGYCSAVLSNFWDQLRYDIQDEWQIGDAFHQLVISSEVGLMKPNSAIYRLLLEKIAFEPSETVFLDDFIENVHAAREVGMHAIHFQNKNQAVADLENLLIKHQ